MSHVRGRVLVPDSAAGPLLRLRAPISFWGGIDAESGRVADPRHPNHGASIAGQVLVVPATIGSSSSSAILLELFHRGLAPAGLILGATDAILVLGVLIAQVMGYGTIPVLELPADEFTSLPDGVEMNISEGGVVSWRDE